MNTTRDSFTKTGGNIDIAFTVVVLASYFATFTSIPAASTIEIIQLILAGIAYLTFGIYGYSWVARSTFLGLRIAYFFIQILLGSLIIFLGGSKGFDVLILLPLAGQSVMVMTTGWSYITNFAIFTGYYSAILPFALGSIELLSRLPVFLAGQVFILVFTQMAVSEEKARKEVERLVQELGEANIRLREYASQVEDLAITKERNRLAREIHDGLGHYLTTINMQIQAALAMLAQAPKKTSDTLTKAQILTHEALNEVRSSVAALRSPTDVDIPLSASFQKLVSNFESSGIHTFYETVGPPRVLPAPVRLTLFRTLQESLNNIYKHARAKQVKIRLDYSSPDHLTLTITDDGVGAKSLSGGFGLVGIQERVNILNGEFQIDTSPGTGFTTTVRLPT